MLTAERLRELLEYDPLSGIFLRIPSRSVAGCLNAKGYRVLSVDGRIHLAQVLAWIAITGALPRHRVTFRNGDRADLRWANLRASGPEPSLTAERLREVLDYDRVTGVLRYRKNRGAMRRAGDIAGRISQKSRANGGGYRIVSLDGREYGAHRLAWLHVNGAWPNGRLDHINRNRDDNPIANLREATHAQNMANRGLQSNSTSGLKGASFHAASRKWRASIGRRHIGLFATAKEAHDAYVCAALKLFAGFAYAGAPELTSASAVTPAQAGAA